MLEKVIFLTPMNMPNISDYFGSSFVTGTDGNWRTSPTLANILRSCNPTLTGDSGDDRDYDGDKYDNDGRENDNDNDQGGSRGAEDLILPGTGRG